MNSLQSPKIVPHPSFLSFPLTLEWLEIVLIGLEIKEIQDKEKEEMDSHTKPVATMISLSSSQFIFLISKSIKHGNNFFMCLTIFAVTACRASTFPQTQSPHFLNPRSI